MLSSADQKRGNPALQKEQINQANNVITALQFIIILCNRPAKFILAQSTCHMSESCVRFFNMG